MFKKTRRQRVLYVGKTWFCLLILALFCLFFSCTQDEYEKGEGKYSQMRADFVEAHASANKTADYVVTDDGDSLALETPLSVNWMTTPDSIYRSLLYYQIAQGKNGGKVAQVISLGRVSSSRLRHPSFFKQGVKTDPVHFESLWVSKNRRYLNVGMALMVGAVDGDAIHRIGMVGDTIVTHANGKSTYRLRFYHDQGGVPENYSQRIYFSLPLRGLDVDSMSFSINTYSGLVKRTLPVR